MRKITEDLTPVTGNVTPSMREAIEQFRVDNYPQEKRILTSSEVVRRLIETGAQVLGIWEPAKTEDESTDQESADETAGDKAEDSSDESTDQESADETAEAVKPGPKTTSRSRK